MITVLKPVLVTQMHVNMTMNLKFVVVIIMIVPVIHIHPIHVDVMEFTVLVIKYVQNSM